MGHCIFQRQYLRGIQETLGRLQVLFSLLSISHPTQVRLAMQRNVAVQASEELCKSDLEEIGNSQCATTAFVLRR